MPLRHMSNMGMFNLFTHGKMDAKQGSRPSRNLIRQKTHKWLMSSGERRRKLEKGESQPLELRPTRVEAGLREMTARSVCASGHGKVKKMCDKCQPHSRYWLHIADAWTKEEKAEMLEYLKK